MQKGWKKNPFLILLCRHWFDPCPLVIIRNQTDPRCRLVQSKARRFSTEPCEKSKMHTIEKSLSILFYAIHTYVFQTSHSRCDGLYAQITSSYGTAYYHYWFFFPFSFLSFSSTDPKFLPMKYSYSLVPGFESILYFIFIEKKKKRETMNKKPYMQLHRLVLPGMALIFCSRQLQSPLRMWMW